MSKPEKALRDTAAALHAAIIAARKAGLSVQWPSTADGLLSMPISETAKARTETARATPK